MKKLILCADGTWCASPDDANSNGGTNVWKIYCAIPDTPDQLKFYDSGVGTDGNTFEHMTGGALGEGLFDKIQDCYSYLSHVYDPGDSIYLFGFSRGAYTARSVGGMIAAFGVPTKNLSNSTTPEIFAAYRETDKTKRVALKTKLTASYGLQDVHIAMVGVWDTVGSLGVPGFLFEAFNEKKYGFLDTALSDCIDHAYHAMALDERRGSFLPTLWTNKDGSPRANDARCEQVWFAGGHGDVGGGNADHGLSDITLSWMMQKAHACGVEFLPDQLQKYSALAASSAAGQLHDDWKVFWGIPKHRTVTAGSHLASSVYDRGLLTGNPLYRPANLTWTGNTFHEYGRCEVLPYQAPVWP